MTTPATNRSGRSRFVPNTVALVLQTIVATLITLAQVKVLTNFLPKDTFGLFASLRGFSLLLTIVAANGLPQLLVRYLPEHESKGERRRALRLSAACVVASFLLLAVLALGVHLLRPWLLSFSRTPLVGTEVLGWFYAMTLGVMLKTVVYGGLNGLRRLRAQMILETISQLALLSWVVVERDHLTLVLLFKIFGAVHLGTLVMGMPILFVSLLRLPPGPPQGARRQVEGYRYGPYLAWASALSLVALAFTDVDRYLLAQLMTLEVLALFHIGARVGKLANRLLGVSNLAFQPEITRLQAEGRASGFARSTRIFIKFNSTLATLIAFAIVLFAKEIILVVASGEYLAAAPLLIILAFCLPPTTVTAPLTTVMKALDQVRGALISDISWAATYVALMIALAPRFGLVGVGFAQLCACVLQLLVALRISSLPIDLRFVTGLILRLFFSGAVAFVPVLVVGMVAPDVPGGAVVLLKTALFVAGLYLFRGMIRRMNVFTSEERDTLCSMFESRGVRFVRGVL